MKFNGEADKTVSHSMIQPFHKRAKYRNERFPRFDNVTNYRGQNVVTVTEF